MSSSGRDALCNGQKPGRFTTLSAPAQLAWLGHARQVVFFRTTEAEKVPAPQASGLDVPGGQYQPPGHTPEHEEEARSVRAPNRPSGHDVQDAAPGGLYEPSAHGWHADAEISPPSPDPYFPAGHAKHALGDLAPLLLPHRPAGHTVHCDSLVSPTAALYLPDTQSEQFGLPATALPCAPTPNFPALQKAGTQVTCPNQGNALSHT